MLLAVVLSDPSEVVVVCALTDILLAAEPIAAPTADELVSVALVASAISV
jgi:hypothetical protein